MLRYLTRLSPVLLALALAVPTFAQEGYPLKGSWIGVWEGSPSGNDVVVVMNWDGKTVSGSINPGPDAIKIAKATMDPKDWSVHIEADGKDAKGAAVHYVIDGKIMELELPTRYITGTWQAGTGKGKFEIRRQ